MKEGILSWSHCRQLISLPSTISLLSSPTFSKLSSPKPINLIYAAVESVDDRPLTARERRQLRNDRRETKGAYNWREEVEERLMKKPKKRYTSWTEELNLDNLAKLGPQWWALRVSRVTGQETAERLARSIVRNFPDIELKVYAPVLQVKRKLKNGSVSVKPKPLFPGCVFLQCVLNKEIHDHIRECDGIGGFIGSKVGNKKRQINKPRPVSDVDMETIFRQAKEEQEKIDRAFEEELKGEDTSENIAESAIASKSKGRSRKSSESLTGDSSVGVDDKLLIPGSAVRVVSGAFADFSGTLKELDPKEGLATVGFTLFGKETLADLDIKDIIAERN